ncbi:hypothetical protein FKW77_010384 [Venturia effusa]|uniref:Extracellular mutant protein 11 C-terminal domain-containing protein n=1 Tax=Venturia effusa TaxID=50376 RepID=A0A517L2B9_9PEZI|nr:hypothetical protein FKW77_010384 [Venturia effusa]
MTGRSGVQNYVNRAGSAPQAFQAGSQGQLRTINQQNAAVQRVAVPPTTKSNIAQARNATSVQPPAPGRATNNGQPLDPFAPTEYSGSTTSAVSKIQVRDSQAPILGDYDAPHHPHGAPGLTDYAQDDDGETSSGEEDDEEEEGSEYDDHGNVEEQQNLVHRQPQQQQQQFQYGQPVLRQQAQQADMNQQQSRRSPFDGDDSYPPTTTGILDDEDMNGALSRNEQFQQSAQREAPLASHSNRNIDAPTQRPVLQHQQNLLSQQQLPPPQHEPASSRPFPVGAQRRIQGQAKIPLRQSPPAPKPFTQSNAHLIPPAMSEQGRPSSAPQPPQPGSQLNPRTRPISTGTAKAPATRVSVPVPQIVQESQAIDQPEVPVEEEPQLDYSEDILKDMNYEQLRDEDYDMDPLKPASVLPMEEQSKSLPERLEFAQKLEDDHQRAFFASLPLTEWEEAGDWFLEKFSDVVKKMTESRKEKRRLAMDFEREVARRHEHVASRKRGIEVALTKMNESGQDVLRGSTPKRQRGAGKEA